MLALNKKAISIQYHLSKGVYTISRLDYVLLACSKFNSWFITLTRVHAQKRNKLYEIKRAILHQINKLHRANIMNILCFSAVSFVIVKSSRIL